MTTTTNETVHTVQAVVPIPEVRVAVAWATASNTTGMGDWFGRVVHVAVNSASAHWVGADTEPSNHTGLTFEATDRYRATWATLHRAVLDSEQTVGVCVLARELTNALKALPKTGEVTVTVSDAGVTFTTAETKATVHADDSVTFPELAKLAGTFNPNGDSWAAYDPALLMPITKSAKDAGAERLRVLINSAQKSTYLAATDTADQAVYMSGLLMPVRMP